MRNFVDYEVTRLARRLTTAVYRLLPLYPVDERFAICQQLRRAAVSIGANIAEGAGRVTEKDFAHFIAQSIGSACEIEYLLIISEDLGFITQDDRRTLDKDVQRLKVKLSRLRSTVLGSAA